MPISLPYCPILMLFFLPIPLTMIQFSGRGLQVPTNKVVTPWCRCIFHNERYSSLVPVGRCASALLPGQSIIGKCSLVEGPSSQQRMGMGGTWDLWSAMVAIQNWSISSSFLVCLLQISMKNWNVLWKAEPFHEKFTATESSTLCCKTVWCKTSQLVPIRTNVGRSLCYPRAQKATLLLSCIFTSNKCLINFCAQVIDLRGGEQGLVYWKPPWILLKNGMTWHSLVQGWSFFLFLVSSLDVYIVEVPVFAH